jgi:hypothetical protein
VPAEVADGSCAGVRPDATADSDMLENIDALVCESDKVSALYTVVAKW